MTCPGCGHDNPSDARFCASCGTSLSAGESRPAEHDTHPGQPRAAIQPRNIEGILRATFTVYGERFWLFVLIASVPEAAYTLGSLIGGLLSVVFVLVGLFLSVIAGAAAVQATMQHYLGLDPSFAECYSRAWRMAPSLIGAAIVILLAMLGFALLSIILIGIPLMFYFLVVWFFVPQVIMVEGTGAIAALGRSREHTKGSWWLLLGIGIIFFIIVGVLYVAAFIPSGVINELFPFAGTIFLAVVSALITPIIPIGGTVTYIDLRIRQGHSLDDMAEEMAR